MALVIFLLILSVLVVVHEFGHYIVARKTNVRVEEFGLGLPPRLLGKKIGETIYSLNLLPFGGFVRLFGEEPGENESIEDALKDPRSFMSKKPYQRFGIVSAGVIMHTILAAVIFYIVLGFNSFRTSYIPVFFDYQFKFGDEMKLGTVVTGVKDDSAAALSGIEMGEAVISIDGVKVNSVYDIRNALTGKLGHEVTIVVADVRGQNLNNTRMVQSVPQADDEGKPVLGVYLTEAVSLDYSRGINKYFSGFLHSYNVLSYSLDTFSKIISYSFETKSITPVSESVAGPVGIYNVVGGLVSYGGGKLLLNLLDFTGLMAISLAFINIMPFPALDGGRLVFIVIEWVSGRKFAPLIEAKIHKMGMIFLLGLLLLVTIKDIFL